MSAFATWLDTFVDEKELDLNHFFEVKGPEGSFWDVNLIPLECVLEAVKAAPAQTQEDIKTIIVKIDHINGDVMHFFEFVAKDMAL